MENLGKAEFDELKRRAAERWPDMAKYMQSARLEDLYRWNPATRRWEKLRALTMVVFERHTDDDQTLRTERPDARLVVGADRD